jgi:hypothetical protein
MAENGKFLTTFIGSPLQDYKKVCRNLGADVGSQRQRERLRERDSRGTGI